MFTLPPLAILALGIAVVLGMIVVLRMNAFLALITAAIVVSLLAPGPASAKIGRVAAAFGGTAGGIGIVIAMAAVIGRCMMDSGAADRVVRFFIGLMGEKRAGTALTASGFVLSIPVFFDTVFYLLVPLARSFHRRTGVHYLKYLMVIGAGGVVAHTLVPPTPGPLVMAETLGVDLGVMIVVGIAIGIPTAAVGLMFSTWLDRRMPVPMRSVETAEPEPTVADDDELPGLFWSMLPIVLPIVLITTSSILLTLANAEHAARLQPDDITDWPAFAAKASDPDNAAAQRLLTQLSPDPSELLREQQSLDKDQQAVVLAAVNELLTSRKFYDYQAFVGVTLSKECRGMLQKNIGRMQVADVERLNRLLLESTFPQSIATHQWDPQLRKASNVAALFGNANLALLLSAAVAMVVLARHRKFGSKRMAQIVESALMSGGVIILITAAGGAFGAMLAQANIGDAVKELFGETEGSGISLLMLAFLIASLLKFAQGSSTVAMITAASMLSAMIDPESLPFHAVYLATAIGAGSMVGSWMNDSGFWIFCKMGGLTEAETLKSWTPLLAVMGVVSMIVTVLLAMLLPMSV